MEKILVLGASGFIGNALYRELFPYFDTHGTFSSESNAFSKNKKFHQWDMEQENIGILLENIKPTIIISALRGNFNAQIHAHFSIIDYILRNDCKLIFLSSANVFDAFTNYPSYEYDKTLSMSIYGKFKIKIENALLRLQNHKYVIVRLPMVFGANSPRVLEIKDALKNKEAIEVFPNVVINATTITRLTQQIHYLINRNKKGVFHLGSNDVVHQKDLLIDICTVLGNEKPLLKNIYESNYDRYLAVLPKDNLLPKNLQLKIEDVVNESIK
ncbi:MAG TPA: sugar nucleotide-binding protein [Salinimicrobium sp.]|nr:sugar nucleotide-binding protein [Salinimicrobium sp.]